MKGEITLMPAMDKQEFQLCADGGTMTIEEAEKAMKQMGIAIKKMNERGKPPAPAPFIWDDDEFGSCDIDPEDIKGAMICGMGIAGHEFYPEDVLKLRDWLNRCIEFMGGDAAIVNHHCRKELHK